MAYDERLAQRIREQLAGEDGITEKAMFGGLAFLLNGNMAVSASGQGGMLLRVGAEESDEAIAQPHAEVAIMRGRPMSGWIRVADAGLKSDSDLAAWVRRGVEHARTLQPK